MHSILLIASLPVAEIEVKRLNYGQAPYSGNGYGGKVFVVEKTIVRRWRIRWQCCCRSNEKLVITASYRGCGA